MREPSVEKHSGYDPLVGLIDKHGRLIWLSDDPFNKAGLAGSAIAENVIVPDRDRIVDALGRCFFKNEIVEYQVTGRPSPSIGGEHPVTWNVRLLPVKSGGEIAGCCLCRPLPEYHTEINDDERQMVKLMCEDKGLKEIAQVMFLSESAIDSKVRQLKDKLGVNTIGGLVATALKESLI
jgi:DNA-binding CsgD family transcriptional regulator